MSSSISIRLSTLNFAVAVAVGNGLYRFLQSTSSSRHQFCCLTSSFAVDVSPMSKPFELQLVQGRIWVGDQAKSDILAQSVHHAHKSNVPRVGNVFSPTPMHACQIWPYIGIAWHPGVWLACCPSCTPLLLHIPWARSICARGEPTEPECLTSPSLQSRGEVT